MNHRLGEQRIDRAAFFKLVAPSHARRKEIDGDRQVRITCTGLASGRLTNDEPEKGFQAEEFYYDYYSTIHVTRV